MAREYKVKSYANWNALQHLISLLERFHLWPDNWKKAQEEKASPLKFIEIFQKTEKWGLQCLLSYTAFKKLGIRVCHTAILHICFWLMYPSNFKIPLFKQLLEERNLK